LAADLCRAQDVDNDNLKSKEHNNCRQREQNLNMRKTNMEITGDVRHSKTQKHFAQQISSDPQEEKKLDCSRLSTAR
jgi:hypothetical protein